MATFLDHYSSLHAPCCSDILKEQVLEGNYFDEHKIRSALFWEEEASSSLGLHDIINAFPLLSNQNECCNLS